MKTIPVYFVGLIALSFLVSACGLTDVDYEENIPPQIESFEAEDPYGQIGEWVVFSVTAVDPEEQALTYLWDRSPRSSSQLDEAVTQARIRGQEDGSYEVGVLVTDGANVVNRVASVHIATFFEDFDELANLSQPGAPFDMMNSTDNQVRASNGYSVRQGGLSLEFIDFGAPNVAAAGIDVASLPSGSKISASNVDALFRFDFLWYGDGDSIDVACYQTPVADGDDPVWQIRIGGRSGKLFTFSPNGNTDVARLSQRQWYDVSIRMDFDSHRWAVLSGNKTLDDDIDMLGSGQNTCDYVEIQTTDDTGAHTDQVNYFFDDMVLTYNPGL